MSTAPEVCVIVPTFNEEAVIAQVLTKLVQSPYSVIVVDDGSSDKTVQRIAHMPVRVVRHGCNLGQGAALQTGIDYALRWKGTKFLVTFDADGQHDVADIPRLLAPLQHGSYDVVLGSRFLRAGDGVTLTLGKRLLLRGAVLFTRLTTGLQITDTHNGLRAFTAPAAARIRITQNRMAHASEILTQIAKLGLRYCEIPVTITYTAYSLHKGQKLFDSINVLWDLLMEKIR
jgi:polyprenyl-phospho-N-acetylgalactosaminyl synthase